MKNTKHPKVSVLTPLYNTNEKHLREAIESILNQTFTDFEFLILNDSPWNKQLKKVVESYDDTRIKYFENEQNIGISASRNKLIDLAQGEYLAVFDHDDISLPDRLKKQVLFLDEHKDTGVVSGSFYQMHKKKTISHPVANPDIKKSLLDCCCIAHPASMIRKSVLSNYQVKYKAQYSPCEDYMLWIDLLDKTMFANLPDILIHYRDFEGNTSHLQFDKMQDCDALVKCIAWQKFPYLLPQITPCITVNSGTCLKYAPKKTSFKLLGFIPIFSKKNRPEKKVWKILGIPLLKVKQKCNGLSVKVYFLGIPILKIRKK